MGILEMRCAYLDGYGVWNVSGCMSCQTFSFGPAKTPLNEYAEEM